MLFVSFSHCKLVVLVRRIAWHALDFPSVSCLLFSNRFIVPIMRREIIMQICSIIAVINYMQCINMHNRFSALASAQMFRRVNTQVGLFTKSRTLPYTCIHTLYISSLERIESNKYVFDLGRRRVIYLFAVSQ